MKKIFLKILTKKEIYLNPGVEKSYKEAMIEYKKGKGKDVFTFNKKIL